MKSKPCSYSKTIKTAQIFPPEANAYGTLFGGKLMAHIDDVAAIAAVRHARKAAVTASTDSVDFLAPVKVGDTISVEGFVTYVHRTSMEVFIKVEKEDLLTEVKTVCATAFLTFVALGEDGRPVEVPTVYPESDVEKMLYAGAEERMERRLQRKVESKKMAAFFTEKLKEENK